MTLAASPQVSLTLNRTTPVFEPGEAISGYVHVNAVADFSASGIEVSVRWTAQGSQAPWTEVVERRELKGGTFKAGEHAEFPFAVIAPPGPETFSRDGVALLWEVAAVVQTEDAATPPEVTQGFELVRGAAFGEADREPSRSADAWVLGSMAAELPPHTEGSNDRPSVLSNLGLGLLVAAVVATVLALGTPSALASASLLLLAIGLACLGIGGLWWAHRNTVASRKTGAVEVSPAPLVVSPGGILSPRLVFPVLKDITLNRVDITLSGRVLSLGQDGETEDSRQFFVRETRPLDRVTRSASEAVDTTVALAIAPDAPLSFECPTCAVRWSLKVHIDIPQWPDFIGVWPVQVVPGSRGFTRTPELEPPSAANGRPGAMPESTPQPVPVGATDGVDQLRQSTVADLVVAIERIKGALNNAERDAAISALEGQRFALTLTAERVSWTSALDVGSDRPIAGGRTVVGTLDDGQYGAALRFPATANDELENLEPGAQVSVSAVVSAWNVLFARPELDAL